MTKNQIAYQANVEANRANLAKEAETKRNNQAIEALRSSELAEAIRANQAREALTAQAQKEAERANQAREAYNYDSLALGYGQLYETSRGNTLHNAQYYAGLDSNERIQELIEQGRNDREYSGRVLQNEQFYDRLAVDRAKNYNNLGSAIATTIGSLTGGTKTLVKPETKNETNSRGGSVNAKTAVQQRQQSQQNKQQATGSTRKTISRPAKRGIITK